MAPNLIFLRSSEMEREGTDIVSWNLTEFSRREGLRNENPYHAQNPQFC